MSKFVLAFILSYAGGLAASIFIDASWGIYLYEMEYFLNPPARWWYGSLPELRFSFIIAVCILISYVIRINKYSQNRIFEIPQAKWLLMLLIMMIIVSFYAVWPVKHSSNLIKFLKILFFLVITYKVIDSPLKFERMIWAFLVGNFYIGWVAHGSGRTGGGRLEGIGPSDTGGDSNATAALLITAVPVLLFYLIKGKNWQRILSLILLAFIIDGIVLVNSRGAFLGLVVGCAYQMMFYVIFNKTEALKERIKIIGCIFVGVCLFVYLTDVTFWERMTTIFGDAESTTGGRGRIFFWMRTFEMVKQHPFGLGTWGYQYLSPQYIPEEMLTNGRRAVHSTYFQVLANFGYIGPLIFGGLILSSFRFMRKIRHYLQSKENQYLYYQGIAIESGFVGFLVASAFIDRLYGEILYWLILFIACFGNIYYLKNGQYAPIAASKEIYHQPLNATHLES